MNVYLVRKVVGYRQVLFGAFASKRKAIESAKNLAKKEKGVHLIYEVVKLPMDCLKAFEKNDSSVNYRNKETIFSVTRHMPSSVPKNIKPFVEGSALWAV